MTGKGSKYFMITLAVFTFSIFVVKELSESYVEPMEMPIPFWKQNNSKNMGLQTSSPRDHRIRLRPGLPRRHDNLLQQKVHTNNVTKVTHVGFLKVHKAGSTTMQNLLFRFGIKYKLKILLPKKGNYFTSTDSNVPILSKGEYYDILAVHTVYDKKRWAKVLHADSAYIGIVRDPFERMVSAAYYYRDVFGVGYLKKVPAGNFIRSIVTQPEKYDTGRFSYTRNSMGKDFGFPGSLRPTDSEKIQQLISSRKKKFLLVLVMEKFDESLVLMKRYLNWSMSDILYLKTNSHQHNRISLTTEEKANFRSTCFLDYALYDEFSQELEIKISNEGEDFQMEVDAFKKVLSIVTSFCSNAKDNATMHVDDSPWHDNLFVTSKDCKLMNTQEIPFINEIRKEYNK